MIMTLRADEKAVVCVFPCGDRLGTYLVDLMTESSGAILHRIEDAGEAMRLGRAEAKARGLRMVSSGMARQGMSVIKGGKP